MARTDIFFQSRLTCILTNSLLVNEFFNTVINFSLVLPLILELYINCSDRDICGITQHKENNNSVYITWWLYIVWHVNGIKNVNFIPHVLKCYQVLFPMRRFPGLWNTRAFPMGDLPLYRRWFCQWSLNGCPMLVIIVVIPVACAWFIS